MQVRGSERERLDGLTPQQLVSEIRDIAQQYEAEVPGRRRHWPESIRSRALALGRLGVKPRKIGDLIGIPRATVFLWCKPLVRRGQARPRAASRGKFIEVRTNPTVRRAAVSPTVGRDDCDESVGAASALVTPDGFRIEFSGPKGWRQAVAAYRELAVVAAQSERQQH